MSCLYSPKRQRGDWAIPALTLGVMFAAGAPAENLSILPNAAELNITGDWTLEIWFKDQSGASYTCDASSPPGQCLPGTIL